MKTLIIGSINIDHVHYVKKFPTMGETIIADESFTFYGGKGANQAIATKRLASNKNHQVFLFAKVGNDPEGEAAVQHLQSNHIQTRYISKSQIKPTGKALILISYLEKDNKIIINKGANEEFNANDLVLLTKAIKQCDIVALQLEVSSKLITEALQIAKAHNKVVIMNPAPATGFRTEWLPHIDYFIPNESELAIISNQKINNLAEVERALEELRKKGLANAIVTLGNAGAYLSFAKTKKWVEAWKVQVVDTTAAGDTFIGGFIAFCLLNNLANKEVFQMITNVLIAAALTVSRRGAQESIPTWKEVVREKNKAY